MIIEIEYDKNQLSAKQCPHADFLLRVGSVACSKCKYNKLTRKDIFGNGYVDCTCTDGKKFEKVPIKDVRSNV